MAMQSYHNNDMNLPRADSRLIIDITPDLRQRLEKAAEQSHLPVYEYVRNILEQTVPSETKRRRGLDPAAVEDLLRKPGSNQACPS